MQAAIWTRYGPPEVLEIRDIEMPEPRDDQVLVKVHAANVFPGDCELRRFDIHPLYWLPLRLLGGIRRPRLKILGQEFAGEVVAVGREVIGFRPGDRIFSPTAMGGAYAEYIRLRPRHAVRIPSGISFREAAGVAVGGLNALHFLRTGRVGPGQSVLIHGAAGSIGTMAVQLAKDLGAMVTAVDHTDKLEALRALGADRVIDYTREDFTRMDQVHDVIIDVAGKSSFARSLHCLRKGGYYVLGNASTGAMLGRQLARFGGRHVRIALTGYRREDLAHLAGLLEAGRIRPVIDRCYPLARIVDAHRYVETGRKIGNVVLTVTEEPATAGS